MKFAQYIKGTFDIFIICELLRMAYEEFVTTWNIVAGFRKSKIFYDVLNPFDPRQIKKANFISSSIDKSALESTHGTRSVKIIIDCSDKQAHFVRTYMYLYNIVLQSSSHLWFDDTVVEIRTVLLSTTTGATLKSNIVLSALHQQQERRSAQQEQCNAQLQQKQRTMVRYQQLAAVQQQRE